MSKKKLHKTMDYSIINRENINEIIKHINNHKASCEIFIKSIDKDVETIQIGAHKYKYVIRDFSEFIKAIIIDCDQNHITNMTFYGSLEVTHFDLVDFFGKERTVYNIHDDITVHYFNENGTNYNVSYFSDGKIDDNHNLKLGLSNISFSI